MSRDKHDLNNENISNKKLFIPNGLGSSRKSWISDSGMVIALILLFVVLVEFVILILFSCKVFDTFIQVVLAFLIGFFIIFKVNYFIVKIFVIHESKLRKDYKEYQEHQITTVEPFWQVMYTDEKGKTVFSSGEEAYFIQMERGYLIGRSPDFKATHYSGVTHILTEVLQAGYKVRYYSYKIGDTNIKPLDETSTKLLKFGQTSSLVKLATAIINYCRSLLGEVRTEIEYLVIYTNGTSQQSTELDDEIDGYVEQLQDTLYDNAKLMTREEIYTFIRQYFNISTMNIYELRRKFSNSKLNVLKVLEENLVEELIIDEELLEDDDSTDAFNNLINKL